MKLRRKLLAYLLSISMLASMMATGVSAKDVTVDTDELYTEDVQDSDTTEGNVITPTGENSAPATMSIGENDESQPVASNGIVLMSDDTSVAAIDADADDVIDTEAELKTALQTSGTVTLGGDIVLTSELCVEAGVTVILDLNGHTISDDTEFSSDNGCLILIEGTLTIQDTDGRGGFTGQTCVINVGTCVIKGGTFTAGSGNYTYVAENYGYLTIEDGSLVDGASYIGILNDNYYGDAVVVIEGGIFDTYAVIYNYDSDTGYTLSASISGGTFNSVSFNTYFSPYIAEGCTIFATSSSQYVVKSMGDFEFTGDGTESSPIQIDSAEELYYFLSNTSDDIVYGKVTDGFEYNTAEYGIMYIRSEKSLDMNGKTVQVPNTVTTKDAPIQLASDADLTIYGGTFIAGQDLQNGEAGDSTQGAKSAISVTGWGATLDIYNMTFENAHYGNSALMLNYDVVATITDTTFNSYYGGAVTAYYYVDVTIEDCIVNQNYISTTYTYCANAIAVAQTATVNVTGDYGMYTCDGYGVYIYSSGGTVNIYGGTFVAQQNVLLADTASSYNNDATVNVYGGDFSGGFGTVSSVNATASINLYGGTFSGTGLTEDAFKNYVASGLSVTTTGNGTTDFEFTVTSVASVTNTTFGGTTYYGTLQEALDAASLITGAAVSVALTNNITEDVNYTASRWLTLDLAGYTWTTESATSFNNTSGQFTITDSVGSGALIIDDDDTFTTNTNFYFDCDVTNNGTITNSYVMFVYDDATITNNDTFYNNEVIIYATFPGDNEASGSVAYVYNSYYYYYYGDLGVAINDWWDGYTVMLVKDVMVSSAISVYGDGTSDPYTITITSDNGSTITATGNSTMFTIDSKCDITFDSLGLVVANTGIKINEAGDGSTVAITNCTITSDEDGASCIVVGDTGVGTDGGDWYYDLTFTGNTVTGQFQKPIHILLGNNNYLTVTGNSFTGAFEYQETMTSGDAGYDAYEANAQANRSISVQLTGENATVTITGNDFNNIYKAISIDAWEESPTLTITGNTFTEVMYAVDMNPDNTNNQGLSFAYNFFDLNGDGDGELMQLMNSEENDDYMGSGTLSTDDIDNASLTLYPYFSDAELTKLVYEDVGEVTVKVATESALETATSDDATDADIITAVTLVTLIDSETLAEDEGLLDMVNDLDAALIGLINADGDSGTLETDVTIVTLTEAAAATAAAAVDGVAASDLQVNTEAAADVIGLALAIVGNATIEEDTVVTVTLEIEQSAAEVSADEDGTISATITYDIYPTMTVTDYSVTESGIVTSYDEVSNDDINAPITFQLFLPAIFNDTNRATVVHKDGETIYSTTTYVVYHDGEDNYIWITTTHFSEFAVSLAANVSYSSGSSASTYTSTVASTSNGNVSISSSKSTSGTKITITTSPDDGYEVGDVTVTYSSGREVSVTDNGDGTYSYLQPGAAVTVTVTFVSEDGEDDGLFSDVDEDAYYYDAVLWAVENGITSGYSDGTFRPDTTCTRAQAVTFLWRAAGEPESTIDNPFSDLDDSAYYYEAVLWAVENGITTGYDDGTFRPDTTCNRGAIVTFLYRFAGEPETSGDALSDVADGAYYYDAVLWAVENGITTGYANGTFQPTTNCTRGQIVTFLYRYLG